MVPSQVNDDYYQFLGLTQSAGKDAIRASYRRLALKYHPDRNPTDPQATAQFQKLEAAYSTLSDPERRRAYDAQYAFLKRSTAASDTNPPPQANNNDTESAQLYRLQIEKLEAAIQQLQSREAELSSQLFKARNECNISRVALLRLQAVADRDAGEEADRNSWYGYFFSRRQSEEEKQARQRRMVDNRAARTVREAELKRLNTFVTTTESLLDDLERRIRQKVIEKHRLQEQEMNRQEAIRLAELRRQQSMQREREAKAREAAESRRREEQAERFRKAQEASERAWQAQEAERIRREQEIRKGEEELEEFLRKFREDMLNKSSKPREATHPGSQTKANGGRAQRGKGSRAGNTTGGQSARAPEGRTSSCLHRSWWAKEEGRHDCERCFDTTRRFAFRCPNCRMVACAPCRDSLKGRV
ncbi:DnaJ domain-containing protein [Trichoderma novae-zelandiae]